jgi:hypothetical protein
MPPALSHADRERLLKCLLKQERRRRTRAPNA